MLARQASHPAVPVVAAVAVFIAFCSASQDIAIDAYAVEVLEKDELGVAVGGRVALYRIAMLIAGAVAITFGQRFGWGAVFAGLALLYVPLAGVVIASPEPPVRVRPPSTLRSAVFDPFVSLFRKPRAAEIIAFILLYKLGTTWRLLDPPDREGLFRPTWTGDRLADSLPIMVDMVRRPSIAEDSIEPVRDLSLQALASLGYVAVDRLTPSPVAGAVFMPLSDRFVMYAAMALETACQGLATGALEVLAEDPDADVSDVHVDPDTREPQIAVFAKGFVTRSAGRRSSGTVGSSRLVMLSRSSPSTCGNRNSNSKRSIPTGRSARNATGAGRRRRRRGHGRRRRLGSARRRQGDAREAGRPFSGRRSCACFSSRPEPVARLWPLVLGLFCGVAVAALLAARRGVRRPA